MILEPDEGPADGLNRGFELCTGQVFGYLNADDKYLPGTLASVAGQFGRHWDIDIIYGDGWTMDETGGRGRKVWSDPFDLRQYARGTSVILQQATFFRRRVWDAGIRFNRLNRTCWDGEFLVDAAFAGASFRHVRHDWGLFRVHPGSITGSGRMREQYAIDRARMAERILGRETTSYDRVMEQALRARKRLRRAYWTAAHIVRNEASS